MPRRIAFLIEQALGHKTFSQNLQRIAQADPEILAHWWPVAFGPQSSLEKLPGIRHNWSLRGSLQARRLIQQGERADLYFFHTQVISLFSAGWPGLAAPVVISLDATPRNYDELGAAYGHRVGNPVVEKIKFGLNRHALQSATRLVAWSEWTRRSLVNDYGVLPARIEVILPGTDVSAWARPAQSLRPVGSKLRLLFVGGDWERKGGPLLLEVFRRSLKDFYELHIVTSRETRLEAQDSLFVHYDLAPNSPALREQFWLADLFVLPTKGDCVPNVLMEAAAAGLPVVSTSVGAIPELVREGETGFLVAPGDATALSERLLLLAQNPDLRLELASQNRAWAETHFDLARNGQRILNLCKEALRT